MVPESGRWFVLREDRVHPRSARINLTYSREQVLVFGLAGWLRSIDIDTID
jgi:hypothetical protein